MCGFCIMCNKCGKFDRIKGPAASCPKCGEVLERGFGFPCPRCGFATPRPGPRTEGKGQRPSAQG